MSKAILLSRVSTSHQTLDSQTETIKNEALKNGFKVDELIIIEDIESAIKLSEEERNGLNKMKHYIETDSSITHVFIYELSRLSRRQLVLFSIRDYLIQHNIQLICCTPYFKLLENGKVSQTANLMFSIFASLAESEMQLKQERMKRGRIRNKMTGKNNCGRVLFGYKTLDDKTIVIDEDNVDFVKDMFELYAQGNVSQNEVAYELNLRYGDATFDKDKMRHKVANLLKRKDYCGNSKYPRIISDELFERVQKALKDNLVTIKNPHRDEALLKRIIFDKKTGRHLTYASNKDKQRYTLKGGTKPTVDKDIIDKNVLKLAITLHKAYVADSEKVRKGIIDRIYVLGQKKNNIMQKVDALNEKIDRTEERLIYGKLSEQKAKELTDRFDKEKKMCESEISSFEEQTDRLYELLRTKTTAELPNYESFTYEENRQLILSMIERIDIWKPSMMRVTAEIYTKVDSFVYILELETRQKKCSLRSVQRAIFEEQCDTE